MGTGHRTEAQPKARTPAGRCFPCNHKAPRERAAVGLARRRAARFNSCPPRCCGASLLQRSRWVSHVGDRNSCLFRRLTVAVSPCSRKGLRDGGVWLFPCSPVQVIPGSWRYSHSFTCECDTRNVSVIPYHRSAWTGIFYKIYICVYIFYIYIRYAYKHICNICFISILYLRANTYICKIKPTTSYSILLPQLAHLVINNISAVVFVTEMQLFPGSESCRAT